MNTRRRDDVYRPPVLGCWVVVFDVVLVALLVVYLLLN